jgi:hypothetical protein
MEVMRLLATTQTEVMNVACSSSVIRVPGCHGGDDVVGNDADRGNECCLL